MNNYFKSYKTIFQATQDISKLERETKGQGQALLKSLLSTNSVCIIFWGLEIIVTRDGSFSFFF